jgi:signal transduction histidine kinase
VSKQLDTLNAIAAALSGSLQVQPILDMIVQKAVELSGADGAGIYEWAPDRQTLIVTAACNLRPEFLQAIRDSRIHLGHGAIGRAVAERTLIEIPDVWDAPDYPFQASMRVQGYRSVLAVPMIQGEEVLGGICLWRREPYRTTPPLQILLTTLASQAAVALGNAHLYEQTERRASELAALVEVGRDIPATLDLTRVLERIAHHAWRILGTDDCDLYLIEPDGQTMRAIVSIGPYASETMDSVGYVGKGVVGSIALSGRPEMLNDVLADPRAVQIPGTPEEQQAMICVPLVSKEQVIGVMALSRMGERWFVQADLDFLVNLAQQAVIAIENARLYQATWQAEAEARRRADLLAALQELAHDISSELALDRLLEAVVRRTLDLLGRDCSDLWLYDPIDNCLRCVVSIADWPTTNGVTLQPGQGVTGQVFATGQPAVVQDYWSWAGAEPAFSSEPVGPVASVPLVWKGQVIGVLESSGRTGAQPFSDAEVRAMSMLATQAAIAIENARLYDAARQRAQELTTALAQQREIDRWKAEFIQNVSHELRTPLTLIQGYAEMMNDGELGPLTEAQREPIAIVTRQVRALQALVSDMMTILQAEAQVMNLATIPLVDLIQAAAGDFQVLVNQSGLVLEVETQPDVPLVNADPRHLRKVIDNLLANAIKFTPTGGRLQVSVYPQQQGACVQVSDTGIGIPPDDLDKVFQRFYQVDGSIRRRYEGTGLGLALVREIVEGHHGWIKAESTGIPGQGCTFTFWLPAAGGDG